ncbi:MAG TPA: hypothetical protein VHF58_07355 [Solirubrobacterales bacterium]|nr:hypothetical protein [Solirubrobacterales bacterium]
MADHVVIERRFRGPPSSANGGYACGTVAEFIEAGDGAVAVTLRTPPPLDRELLVERNGSGAALREGDTLVAEGEVVPAPDLELPAPIGFDEARAAGGNCPWGDSHPYPMCFTCGPDRGPPDSLHLLTGPVADRELVADAWVPDQGVANAEGIVDPKVVWAALDCPTGNGSFYFHPPEGPPLLGRLTAKLVAPVRSGEPYVVMGWPIDRNGRKHRGGSALFDGSGELVAFAEGLWIELRPS